MACKVTKAKMSSRARLSRSRSPERKGVKLHVSNLPIGFPQGQLITIFSQYGTVGKVRVIRNGPKGFPLRHNCYAFVEMHSKGEADRAIEELNKQGWNVSLSNDARGNVKSSTPPREANETRNLIWSGFLSRSTKHRVGVDIYLLSGDESDFPTHFHHLDISHRAKYSDIPKYTPSMLLLIDASNETQAPEFSTYIEYFQKKERAGIIPLGQADLFILPIGPVSEAYMSGVKKNQMLGVVFRRRVAAMHELKQLLEKRES